MISRPGPGCQTSITALQISTANSISVPVKISGEYWYPNSTSPRCCSAYFITSSVPRVARAMHSALSTPKTTRRKSGAVALYMWMVAVFAPTRDSAVRSIRSSRAWVSTEIVTSSGTPRSITCRTKSKSVWLADGKPTSISL